MKPLILAPAGDLKGAEQALKHGADIIYAGIKGWSLRPNAFEMSREEFRETVGLVKARHKAIYLAMNCFYRSGEIPRALEIIGEAAELGVDGVIVSELGLIREIKQKFPRLKIQLSVQISASNTRELEFYKKLGIDGVVLPRNLVELEPENLKKLSSAGVKLEVFLLGDDSPNYDGHCFLSSFLNQKIIKDDTDRDCCSLGSANRNGYCYLMCKRKMEYLKEGVFQGEDFYLRRGDLALFNRIEELADSGAAVLKIQGREFPEQLTRRLIQGVRRLVDGLDSQLNTQKSKETLNRMVALKLRLQENHLRLLAKSHSPFWLKARKFIEPLWDNLEIAAFLYLPFYAGSLRKKK